MQFFSISDKGKLRDNNEDYCLARNIGDFTLLVLADGMGGHNGGETASRCAIDEIYWRLSENLSWEMIPGQIMMLMAEAIGKANEKIMSLAKSDPSLSGMGTTCDVCLISNNTAYIAHVGDSRVYKISKNGKIKRLTRDHSLVEYMLEQGTITPKEALTHPQKNIILRALGITKEIETDISHEKISPEDVLLLCSDGLTNMLDEKTIAQTVIKQAGPEEIASSLVKLANDAGGADNITVVVAKC